MRISLDTLTIQTILSFLLAMVRVQGFFLTAPIFSKTSIPAQIKIGLSAVFVFTFYNTIFSTVTTTIPTSDIGLSLLIVLELMLGAALGFLVALIFEALSTFAHLLGIQMGQSAGQMFNPSSGEATNAISAFYGNLAMLFFLLTGGLYNLALILKKSFEIIPLASLDLNYAVLAENYLKVFNNIFIAGLKMIFPMMAVMFIIDIFIAMFSKIMPQTSMFFLLAPAKIMIFLLVSTLIVNTLYLNIEHYFAEDIYEYLDQLFWVAGP